MLRAVSNRARSTRLVILLLAIGLAPAPPASALPDDAALRGWIEDMKASPKGPFQRIRWFCEDGTVLPPKESCREHGGGIQHGLWQAKAAAPACPRAPAAAMRWSSAALRALASRSSSHAS